MCRDARDPTIFSLQLGLVSANLQILRKSLTCTLPQPMYQSYANFRSVVGQDNVKSLGLLNGSRHLTTNLCFRQRYRNLTFQLNEENFKVKVSY